MKLIFNDVTIRGQNQTRECNSPVYSVTGFHYHNYSDLCIYLGCENCGSWYEVVVDGLEAPELVDEPNSEDEDEEMPDIPGMVQNVREFLNKYGDKLWLMSKMLYPEKWGPDGKPIAGETLELESEPDVFEVSRWMVWTALSDLRARIRTASEIDPIHAYNVGEAEHVDGRHRALCGRPDPGGL